MTVRPMPTDIPAMAALDPRVEAWRERHVDLWAAVCHSWEVVGGAELTLHAIPLAHAAPIHVEGVPLAWLVGDATTHGQLVWLAAIAALIGDAIAHECELETMTDELVDTYDQLTFLYETARTLSAAITLPDALRAVLAQARHTVGAAGSALIVMPPGAELLVLTDGIVPDPAFLLRANETATRLDRALVANTIAAVHDTLHSGDDLAVPPDDAVTSMVVAPIQTAEGVATAACYGALKPGGFTAGNRRLMQAVVEQSITIVARFALQEEQIRRSRIARDLELAAQIQTALLPAAFPGAVHIRLAARILPASEVGGDFYIHPDREIPAGGVVMVGVGDVAGKGVAAALITTMCLSALRAEVRHSDSPVLVLRAMRTSVAGELDRIDSFVTCALAAYDREAHALCYAIAGHNPPLIWHAGTGAIEELPATGLPIGIDAGLDIGEASAPFLPGDVLLLYTDGVTEAMAPDGEQFGLSRLYDILATVARESPDVIQEAIIDTVGTFAPTQRDDITIVVLKAEG